MSRLFTFTQPATPPEAKSLSAEPLRGRSLSVARATWITVAVFAVGFFAAGIPFEFAFFRTVCQPACNTGQLSQTGLQSLQDLGLSLNFYATYLVGLDVILAVVYVTVAAVIFLRKPDDRMALFASFALLTFGIATFPSTIEALTTEHTAWWWPYAFLSFSERPPSAYSCTSSPMAGSCPARRAGWRSCGSPGSSLAGLRAI